MKYLFTVLLFLVPTIALAQTVINPTKVEFTPSAEHNAVVNGAPVLDHYDMTVVRQDSNSVIIFTYGLGKPTPTNNLISVPVPNLLTMTPGVTAVAYVDAVSILPNTPVGRSAPSNPFVRVVAPSPVTNLVVK